MSDAKFTPRVAGFEWNIERLMDVSTYLDEAARGKALGLTGLGRCGVSCPRCYLSISATAVKTPSGGINFCQCDDQTLDIPECLAALGLSGLTPILSNKDAEVI